MKNLIKLLVVVFAFCSFNTLQAQGLKMPQLSSGQTITQDLGLGTISITYSRPNLRGRVMLGGQEPYGKVWRTGANSATVIKFTDDVTIEGNKIPAGEYGLFSIPDPTEWTIILNKNSKQWGAYTYKQEDDVLRFKVKAIKMKDPLETFTIQFANVKPASCEMHLMWQNTDLAIHITTDVDTRIMANIDVAMKGEKKPYFAAAQYYYENNKDLAKALTWISEAEKTNPASPAVKVWKARIQLKMGDKKAALATAQEGAKLAKDKKDDEYERLNNAVIAQAKN